MPKLDTQILTQLLAKKCELLMQLRQLGQRQLELIDTSDLSQLLNLLAGKQRIIGALQSIEQQLDPFRDQSPEQRNWASDDERRRCAELAAAGQQILVEVVELEKQSENHLVLRRDEAASRLHEFHFALQARQAYEEPVLPVVGQVDLSAE